MEMPPPSQILRFALSFLVLLSIGCGGRNGIDVSGTVTLDGSPLTEGRIRFVSIGDTGGGTAGAKIENGQFVFGPDDGLVAGTYRVEISSVQKTGRMIPDMEGEGTIEQYAEAIPSRYNSQSELTADIKPDGGEPLAFDLHTN